VLRFLLVGAFPETGANNCPVLPWVATYLASVRVVARP
jgi:hypothetical protein